MHVKICGITHLEDALLSIAAGATMLGFNFSPLSKRRLLPQDAGTIIAQLPSHILTVGIFVNSTVEEIAKTKAIAGFTITQLHGDEGPEFCAKMDGPKINGPMIKLIKTASLPPLPNLFAALIDAEHPTERGGTGMLANWKIAKEVAESHPLILAGGLTPENIKEAIRYIRPFGVDICSGVEEKPGIRSGKKSAEKLKRLFKEIENA